jgi:hypothetical protein
MQYKVKIVSKYYELTQTLTKSKLAVGPDRCGLLTIALKISFAVCDSDR